MWGAVVCDGLQWMTLFAVVGWPVGGLSLAILPAGHYCGGMSVTIDRVLEDGLCLTEESRILLAERLLESIAPDAFILAAQVAVAEQRAKDMESGVVKGIPGDEALRRVRASILQRSQA